MYGAPLVSMAAGLQEPTPTVVKSVPLARATGGRVKAEIDSALALLAGVDAAGRGVVMDTAKPNVKAMSAPPPGKGGLYFLHRGKKAYT